MSDGRVYVFGGHDMQSNNGLYKVNIFDPETETWVRRSEPCFRRNWTKDPFGLQLFAGDPNAPFYPSCDPGINKALSLPTLRSEAPGQIPYGGHFDLRVAGPANQIGSVVLLRSDHNTLNLTTAIAT